MLLIREKKSWTHFLLSVLSIKEPDKIKSFYITIIF